MLKIPCADITRITSIRVLIGLFAVLISTTNLPYDIVNSLMISLPWFLSD